MTKRKAARNTMGSRRSTRAFDRDRVSAARQVIAGDGDGLPGLVRLYKLLASRTRLEVLIALGIGELCVGDISRVLGLTVAAASQQLKVLADEGWLRMRKEGKMVYYELSDKKLHDAIRGDLAIMASRRQDDLR